MRPTSMDCGEGLRGSGQSRLPRLCYSLRWEPKKGIGSGGDRNRDLCFRDII